MKQGLTSPYKVKASRTGPTTGQHEIHGESWGVAINEAMDFILIFRHKKPKNNLARLVPCNMQSARFEATIWARFQCIHRPAQVACHVDPKVSICFAE